ncbi:hypothetical protein, partial [Mesorhizobium sp.]
RQDDPAAQFLRSGGRRRTGSRHQQEVQAQARFRRRDERHPGRA